MTSHMIWNKKNKRKKYVLCEIPGIDFQEIQYIPRNMHTVFALLCFVVVINWLIFPYPSGLLHWHCGNLTIAPVPAKQPWWIWINTSCEFIMNDCITTTKQSTTKPCAYFLGYTVRSVKCNHRIWLCFVVFCCGLVPAILTLSFRVASRKQGQSFDNPGASNATLKNMGQWITWTTQTIIKLTQRKPKQHAYFTDSPIIWGSFNVRLWQSKKLAWHGMDKWLHS